jgi:hypothetical protein
MWNRAALIGAVSQQSTFGIGVLNLGKTQDIPAANQSGYSMAEKVSHL